MTVTVERTHDMARSVVVLPEEEQAKLRAVRDSDDLDALRTRVLALRVAGWPLRAIGDPINAPRSTVKMWQDRANPDAELPEVPAFPKSDRARGVRVVRKWPDVPAGDRELIFELAKDARKVRGATPKDAPIRKKAEELDKRIETYVERGVPVKKISEHMGVTPRAVAARIERYEARKNVNNN